MDAFYAGLLRRRRPLSPAEALRRAQLEMLEHNRQTRGDAWPQTWAAFTSSGAL
jgi:CHAT domain-containing protein